MDGVCRLCLADTTSCDEYSSYDGRIQLLIPEIDLNVTPTFTLCDNCSDTLDSAYIFKQKCLQIEERINNYISKIQTPLTNLRWVRDQNYDYNDKAIREEVYEISDSNSDLDDRKDIDSISVEYNLTFPTYIGKERIEDKEIRKESFKSSSELDQHRIVQSAPNIVLSDSGNNKSSKKYLLRPKIKDREKMDRYSCDICNRGLKSPQSLAYHRGTHNNTNLICPIYLRNYGRVKTHVKQMHICKVCNKEHGPECNLQQHMLRHTGERPYKCGICGRDFVLQKNLNEHMRTHQMPILEGMLVSKQAPFPSEMKHLMR